MRILRVSSHPTKNFHGIGLHPHKISSTKRFKTFFSTFKISKQEEIIEVSNYDVFISDIYFDKRPTEGNKFKIIFFYLNRIIKLLRFSFRSIFLGANKSVQIVHIHSPMYILIALWGKLFNKLTCITYHGTDYLRIKNNKIYSFFCKKIIDVGFCISPHMIDKMKINHKEVYYIPNGIDSKIFKDLNYKRKKIFLAVGSLKKEKSYENLINAFSLLLNDYPEYKLNIAGEGPQKIKLIRIVKKLNISDNVIFLGNLNKKKLIEVYNRSEFFILSSSSEGFPKVVLEALSVVVKSYRQMLEALVHFFLRAILFQIIL